MFSAAELLRSLSARRGGDVAALQAADAAWLDWFEASRDRAGSARRRQLRGEGLGRMLEVLAARPLRMPEPIRPDPSWFASLRDTFRQSYDPPGPHDRRERRIAWGTSLGLHLLVLAVLWVFGDLPPPSPAVSEGDSALQVQYIGIGTPEDAGAGAEAAQQPASDPTSAASAAAAAAAEATASAQPAVSASPFALVPADTQPLPPTPEVSSQPLQVTETAEPDSTFVLPPTTPPTPTTQPRLQVQEIRPQQRDLTLQEPAQAPQVRLPQTRQTLATPQVSAPQVQIRVRELEVPQAVVSAPSLPSAQAPSVTVTSPSVRAPVAQVQGRDVTLREPARGTTPQASPVTGSGRDAVSAGPPAASSGVRPAAAAGSGTQAATTAGALPSTRRGDDWGASARSQAGARAGTGTGDGLFQADGRPRLAPGTAEAGGGFPPGADGWDRQMLDRHGTWMTRAPNDYAPTRFDQYWLPSGTLLQEWVRRGVRNMEIPVPGTSKRIRCVISVLQAGGGCGVFDPNLQDQPATARPPPDIPWKPELQEN